MKKIIIFSGTTEGRMLSEKLSERGIHHTVCVATDCGAEVMEENSNAQIHVGRMDSGQMTQFIKSMGEVSKSIIIDATHPYAVEATANIKSAALSLGCRYIRVIRERARDLPEDAAIYDDISVCARSIDSTSGNILLTTGSKELSEYCSSVSDATRRRTYVRVLPALESIELCRAQGIETDHIIAMQGPFGRELNEALIRQYSIRHLITKDSGTAGGMDDKVSAAKCTKAKLHVIARPLDEDGMSISEVFSVITGEETAEDKSTGNVAAVDAGALKVTLCGIGMGTEKSMTAAALEAIRDCDICFGAGRLIRDLACPVKYEMYRPQEIIPVLEKENIRHAVIAFSGDASFYSGAESMLRALKQWRNDIDTEVLPGISSVSYLAAKLCENYDNAVFFSLHGRNTQKNYDLLISKVRFNEKVFVLLSGAADLREIAKRLSGCDKNLKIYAGVRLSYEDECVRELALNEAVSFEAEGPVTALIVNTAPARRPVIPTRRDDEFLRSDVPMTKECVRHESIIRLELKEGDIFYDIGGGTGSVAIEAASLDQSLEVYTFEKNKEAAELIRTNMANLGVTNVTVVEGEAQRTLPDLPKPDCVFVGGSSGKLREIIDIIHSKGRGIRFVINAVTLETIGEIRKLSDFYDLQNEEAMMISVSNIEPVGSLHMFKGQNPVWIFSFTV